MWLKRPYQLHRLSCCGKANREAILQVAKDFRKELLTVTSLFRNETQEVTSLKEQMKGLREELQEVTSLKEQVKSLKAKLAPTSSSQSAGAEASAPPSHATAALSATATTFMPTVEGRVIKPEAERLCVSMWGIKSCPGTASSECLRKHIPLCSNVICYGNEEVRKACANGGKWHGHIRGLIRAEKKNEKEREFKKDFAKAWHERRNQPQGNSSRGPLQSQQGQPQRDKAKGQKGPTQPRRQKGWNQKPPGPGPRTLGDFFPAPAPVGNAWARPLVTPQVTPQSAPPVSAGADAKQQILHLLQNIGQLGQLLQSTGF